MGAKKNKVQKCKRQEKLIIKRFKYRLHIQLYTNTKSGWSPLKDNLKGGGKREEDRESTVKRRLRPGGFEASNEERKRML